MFNYNFEELKEKWVKGATLSDEEIGFLFGKCESLIDRLKEIKNLSE